MRTVLSALVAVILLHTAALAQTSRYQPYDNQPAQTVDRSQELIDALNKLIDEADRARAADPRFLRDLRDLANRYDRPWRVTLLHDDFRDGDIAKNPAWTVKAGEYTIDWRDGLRSRIEPASATTAQDTQPQQDQGKQDAGKALLGALLREVLKDPKDQGSQEQQTQQQAAPRTTYSQIYSAVPITNAFAINLELSSYEKRGRFAFGPYQGNQQSSTRATSKAPATAWPTIPASSRRWNCSAFRRAAPHWSTACPAR
jgi:hypothetical protein